MNKFGVQDMVSPLTKVLMCRPQHYMSKVNLKKWHYTEPLDQKKIEKNYNDFFILIKNFGIEIIELKIENEKQELCDSVFTHDPSLVINEGAIILNMGKELRKKEIEHHEKFYMRMDIPVIGKIKNNGTVEGGDCLWINKNTLLVGESHRTNKEGIQQLKIILKKFNIDLIPIKLPKYKDTESCFHLMSIISMLDHDLALACFSKLPFELINIFKEYKINLISIPEDEYSKSETLAVNCLAIAPRKLILISGYPKTQELLLKENNEINLFNGDELCLKAEGGPTCLTRPLKRC